MEMILKEVALIDYFFLDVDLFCDSKPTRSSLRICLTFVSVNTIEPRSPIYRDEHIALTQLFMRSLLRNPRQEMTVHINRIVPVF